MLHRILFCLFILCGLSAKAEIINLRGKVVNQSGMPIANAIVTLVNCGFKDTTGTDGAYSITNGTAIKSPFLPSKNERISLSHGVLEFCLNHSAGVKVEIFNLQGRLLEKEFLRDALPGVYRLNIAKTLRSINMLAIHASIDGREMNFIYFSPNSGKYSSYSTIENSNSIIGSLSKVSVINDTLKIFAPNYLPMSMGITSYDQILNITLDTEKDGVLVLLDQPGQLIEGFGINDTWAKESFSGTVADALFTTNGTGIGLSILRVGMNSSGAFASSNISSDISAAKSRGAKIIGSTWSPPGSYKAGQAGGSGSENGGGHVKPENYEKWAKTIADFAKSNNLYAMSPQNEPDFASCGSSEPCSGDYATTLYTAEEMTAFIKVVGPKLQAAGVKVIAPEASEWIHTWSDTSACCTENSRLQSTDPLKCGFPPKCQPGKGYDYGHSLAKDDSAWASLDILGVHEYDTQRAEAWPADVPKKKPVWQTEMCGTKWWPQQGPSSDIKNGIAVAGWIHDALVKGEASAWLWWWYKSSSAGNSGLLLSDGTDTKRHWTLGNYSKFVRPGFTRVNVAGSIPKGVLLSAYKGADGTVAIVAIDSTITAATVPITISGVTAPTSMRPWVTSANDDLKSKDAVTVSNGGFTATLAGMTVTTFVGNK